MTKSCEQDGEIPVPQNAVHFMISYASIGFSRGALFHGVSYLTHITYVKHMWILRCRKKYLNNMAPTLFLTFYLHRTMYIYNLMFTRFF
jgi:hypothetical protein